ncbi:hypothetical protein GLYMA_04G169300v4 [Glycine max]|nr:hypothetical protein GLYMA_04G169300v4 [Glycine max]KAH1111759.1 hypothetical protein GYH30_010206 [Glycine max]
MGEHVVLSVLDPLIAPGTLLPQHGGDGNALGSLIEGATHVNDVKECDTLEEEKEDLIQMVECRICQEDDTLQNLDIPCACSGTLKFAHTKCIQLWCYEKGDTICEICNKPFKPGYTANSPVCQPGDTSIGISDDWAISSSPLDLHNARLLAIAALEHQVPETEHEDYVNAGTGGTSLWHSVGLIVSLFNLLLKFYSMVFRCFIRHGNSKFFYFFFPIIHGTTPPFLIVVLQIYLCICGTYPCIFVGCMVAIFIFL